MNKNSLEVFTRLWLFEVEVENKNIQKPNIVFFLYRREALNGTNKMATIQYRKKKVNTNYRQPAGI